MNPTADRRKKWIRIALAVVILLDVGLVAVNWSLATGPQNQNGELLALRQRHALMQADIRRAAGIEKNLPNVSKEADNFYEKELRSSANGYSSIVADLGRLTQNAGLRTGTISFRQQELAGRGVSEISISTAVEGDYPSLVSFINGLERSDNFYLLDGLSLASSQGGILRLNLQLRTYFRN